MKIYPIIIFFICTLQIVGCFPKKQISKEEISSSYLKVSFISYGTGIDYQQKLALDSLIHNHEVGCAIKYSIFKWGREGEMDYCFVETNSSCFDKFKKSWGNKVYASESVKITIEKNCGEKIN